MKKIFPPDSIPTLTHVAIIPDGNGRWAKQQGLRRNQGHQKGVENVGNIVQYARELGIKYLTFYAFSAENWDRPQDEVEALMTMLEHFLKTNLGKLHKYQFRLKAIGRINELPPKLCTLLNQAIEATSHHEDRTLIFALNYGARSEVIDAVKAYSRVVLDGSKIPDNLNWKEFAHYLYTDDIPDPDLIIRTSGETRLSNFLLLQGAYSEFFFSQKLWPDFSKEDFIKAIESFNKRERRFGKTGEQIRKTPAELILNR